MELLLDGKPCDLKVDTGDDIVRKASKILPGAQLQD